MKLTNQQNQIYLKLQDGNWHCPEDWKFMKDDRKRISELNILLKEQGQVIIKQKCDCGRHISGVVKRKLVSIDYVETPISKVAYDFQEEYVKRSSVQKQQLLTF